MKETRDLTTGSIPGRITRLALPILGASFVQMMYSFVDMAWLGRLGAEEVAAAAAASVFIWLANSLSLFSKVGAESAVGYAIGSGDEEGARSFATHASSLSLLAGLAVMLLFLLLAPLLIGFYGMSGGVDRFGVTYLRITALGIPLIFFTVSLTGIYNAAGHSEVPFRVTTLAVLLNILLDPLLIFTLRLGVAGAALATLISQAVGAALILRRIRKEDRLLGLFPLLTLALEGNKVLLILKIGGPVSVMNALFSLISLILGRFASLHGGHIGVTALSIGGQLEGVSFNTAQGFSTALGAFVAQNYGAGNRDRIHGGLRFTLRFSLIVGGLATLLFYFFGTEIFALIVPDPAAAAEGGRYLRVNAVSEIFMMIEITFQGFFYGLQRSLPPSLISITGNLIRIPAAWLLLLFFPGLDALWFVIMASSVLKGLAALGYYLLRRN